jgi:hypothetical protein
VADCSGPVASGQDAVARPAKDFYKLGGLSEVEIQPDPVTSLPK